MLQFALRAFWRRIQNRINIIVDFRESTLIVSDWNQKLLTQRSNARQTRSNYLKHFDYCFDLHDRNVNHAQVWVNIEVENVVAPPIFSDVTFLWKSSCLHFWKICFHDSYHQKSRVKIIQYSFMFIRDADDASMKLNEINYFRIKDDLIYHKVYNLIKDFFVFIIKKHLSFNNFYFEKLFYFQSELLRWHRINRDENFAFSMSNMKTTFIIDFSSFKDW